MKYPQTPLRLPLGLNTDTLTPLFSVGYPKNGYPTNQIRSESYTPFRGHREHQELSTGASMDSAVWVVLDTPLRSRHQAKRVLAIKILE